MLSIKTMAQIKIEVIFLIILMLIGCRTKNGINDKAESPMPVTTARVAKVASGKEIEMSGNIEGSKTVRLGFMVAGKIDYIAANEGEPVSEGKLLASLDPSNYAIAKELADIQVNQVQDEYDRLKSMHDKNSLSESDFAKISFGLQEAKAQQKLHAKNLSDTKLYSPIDGVLLKKLAEVGEITGTGTPLFVVSDIRKIKVNAFIPENELHYLRIGQSAKVNITSLGKTFEGKITEVGSAADASSRSFPVKIEVGNPGLLIRPGMIAEVTVPADDRTTVLAVPAEAVMHDFNDQSFVYVADTVRNKAFKRVVSPGDIIEDKIEITSGLNENELVITGGQQKVTDGLDIIINE